MCSHATKDVQTSRFLAMEIAFLANVNSVCEIELNRTVKRLCFTMNEKMRFCLNFDKVHVYQIKAKLSSEMVRPFSVAGVSIAM